MLEADSNDTEIHGTSVIGGSPTHQLFASRWRAMKACVKFIPKDD